jgi:DNA-binding NarL/FixJ family response regulator
MSSTSHTDISHTNTSHKVFVVGDSLFAEAIVQLLAHSAGIEVAGYAESVDTALAQIAVHRPDVVMVLGLAEQPMGICPLLAAEPDLPVIRATLHFDGFRLIHSRQVGTRTADLLAAILELPIRR